jgi:tetratricopeptide (TPR) repeat protein
MRRGVFDYSGHRQNYLVRWMIERTMNVVKALGIKRLTQITVCGGLSMIASQHQSALAQVTASDAPQWRSRSELPNTDNQKTQYQRVADRSFVNSSSASRASLGRPTNVSEINSIELHENVPAMSPHSGNNIPTGASHSRYRDVPNSPWERSPQNLDPNRPNTSFDSFQASAYQAGIRENQAAAATVNMIRQPATSVDRVYSQESMQHGNAIPTPVVLPGSKGLPDRRDFQQPSDPSTRGMEMTMELSGYERPTTKGFINQPRQSLTSSNRTTAQRLPYGGVAISNDLESTPIGLGYPEQVRSSEATGFDTPNIRSQQPVASPQSTNAIPVQVPASIPSSIPREAIRDLPITEEAIRKAAQINERSQNRDSTRTRYAQQHSLDQARSYGNSNNRYGLESIASQPYESSFTTRSNVVGVIGGIDLQARVKPLGNLQEDDYPYSTNSLQVVPASVGIRQSPSEELGQSRMQTASRVSAELLDASRGPLAKAPLPIEPPTGWKTIEDNLKQHLANCDDLLRRGAILSAREEVLMGMRSLFRSIDLRGGTWTSEPAMDQALAAFAEESDFYRSNTATGAGQNTERIISGHKTNALKQTQLHLVSPDLAAQHYRAYAKQQWLIAAQGHPWTADLLFAYGKTLEREADQNPNESQMRRSQAVVCYQAAMEINPRNADNANQLGFALLQLDRTDEAHVALNHSIRVNPKAETWNNLAEVYRRRGEADQVAYAQRNVQSLKQTVAPEMDGVPEVIEVDVKTFASVSPYPTGMQPGVPSQSQVQQASAVAPPAKSSWFGKLFK